MHAVDEGVSPEIEEVMAEETNRFSTAPRSSVGGIPVVYADHMNHLRNPRLMRQDVDDDSYFGHIGFGRLPAKQGLPKRG